jgi:TolB protein
MLDDVFDIVTIGVDGENALVLTSGGNNQNPSWSPDGYHIVFSSNRDGSYKLYTMSWIGTDISLISQSGEDFSPVWSSRYNWKFEK